MLEGGKGELNAIAPVVGCIIWCRFRFLSSLLTRALTMALGVEILVGISCRTIREVELVLSMHCTSNFNTVNSGGVDEGLEMVGIMDGCHGRVWLTIEVVMVIKTFSGTPIGDAHSCTTGKLFFQTG